MKKATPAILVTLLFGGLLAACADVPAFLRRHTYPPNFKYIDQTQLRSAMWQLADKVAALDRVMRESGVMDTSRRAEAEQLIREMLAATRTLQTEGRPTNHPLIGEHLDGFQHDLTQALAGLKADPPNYYLVGTVSGTCLSCHSPQ
jgi:hypothetical protein